MAKRSTARVQEQARDGASCHDLISSYAHVVRLKRFFNLRTLADYDRAQFDVMHMLTVNGKLSASEHFLRNGGRVVESVTYRPGEAQFVDEAGFESLNLYRLSVLKPDADDDPQPWIDMLDR